jgi:hypothetical protein
MAGFVTTKSTASSARERLYVSGGSLAYQRPAGRDSPA